MEFPRRRSSAAASSPAPSTATTSLAPFPFSFGSPPTSGSVGGGSCLSLRGFDEHPAAAAEVAFKKSTHPGRLEAEGETTERRWAIDVMGEDDREAEEEADDDSCTLSSLLLHLLFVRAATAAASAGTSMDSNKSMTTTAARPPLLQGGDRMAPFSNYDFSSPSTLRGKIECVLFSFLQKVLSSALSIVGCSRSLSAGCPLLAGKG